MREVKNGRRVSKLSKKDTFMTCSSICTRRSQLADCIEMDTLNVHNDDDIFAPIPHFHHSCKKKSSHLVGLMN